MGLIAMHDAPSAPPIEGDHYVSRRPERSRLVDQLISPVSAKLRRSIPRLRRSFPPQQARWSVARWVRVRRGSEAYPRPGEKT